MPENIPPPRSLDELRAAITDVDSKLLALLAERASLSFEVGDWKRHSGDTAVYRPEREAALLADLAAHSARGCLPESHLAAVYAEILSSSRALQGPQRIALVAGETYSLLAAARHVFGRQALLHPLSSDAEVIQAVLQRACELGFLCSSAPEDSSRHAEDPLEPLRANAELQILWEGRLALHPGIIGRERVKARVCAFSRT